MTKTNDVAKFIEDLAADIDGPFKKILLDNPYSIEANTEIQLLKGFGVLVGEASVEEGFARATSLNVVRRSISFVSTMKATCKASGLDDDREALLSFSRDLYAALKNNRAFTSLVVGIEYNGDNGLSYFGGDDGVRFISLQTNLTIIIKEVF